MSDVLIALAIAWVVITLLGHLSWVVTRTLLRIITGTLDSQDRAERPSEPNRSSDLAAASRVVARLQNRGHLGHQEAENLRSRLRFLAHEDACELAATPTAPTQPIAAETSTGTRELEPDLSGGELQLPTSETETPLMAQLVDESPVRSGETHSPPATNAPKPVASAPKPAAAAGPTMDPRPVAEPQPIPTTQPDAPALSKAELIQSFLAAHNIRWGELVAGMLIVVCSIGLVISLWSPLVATHRVVPSLIFLAANAAIFSAGLYTLSRWRLRHTSRAVLVIATLLVPLSVLAGLAAAGASGDAVQLSDPFTLAGITIASVFYLLLLYFSGRALVRTQYATAVVASVAGPVAILPFTPAAVRTFEEASGWLLAVGSVCVAMVGLWLTRARRDSMTFGRAGSRARLLIIGLGAYALAIAAGYIAFMARDYGMEAYLALALAAVPAVVALAGLSHSLMKGARIPTQAMTGAVLYVILLGVGWATLPSALYSHGWFWSWAIILSGSLSMLGWIARQPRQVALATIPIGMALVMTSPTWMGEATDGSLAIWRRILGGEPLLATTLVTLLVGSIAFMLRRTRLQTPMAIATIGWATLLLTTASILAVAPTELMGVAPQWSVSVILAATTCGSVIAAFQSHRLAIGTVVATLFSWLSIIRPVEFGQSIASLDSWMMTLAAVGTTFIVLSELSRATAIKRIWNPSEKVAGLWQPTSAVSLTGCATLACFYAPTSWSLSTAYLTLAAIGLAWNWTLSKDLQVLRLAQVATVAIAVVIGYGRFTDWLFREQAWTNGDAVWAWSILIGLVAGFWLVARQVTSSAFVDDSKLRLRLAALSEQSAAPFKMIDGGLIGVQTSLVVVAALWSVAAMFSEMFTGSMVRFESPWWLSSASLALALALNAWVARKEQGDPASQYLVPIASAATLLWASTSLANVLPLNVTDRLIGATSLTCLVSFALTAWSARKKPLASEAGLHVFSVVGTLFVSASSVGILHLHWYRPISADRLADLGPTIAVAVWWLAAAAGFMWSAKRNDRPDRLGLSALLAPLAVVLLVPAFVDSDRFVWVQVAGIASSAWIVVARTWIAKDVEQPSGALIASSTFVMLVGIGSAFTVIADSLFGLTFQTFVDGPASFLATASMSALWIGNYISLPGIPQRDVRMSWPLVITLMSGQCAWLATTWNLSFGLQTAELTGLIMLVGGITSLVRYQTLRLGSDFVHVTVVSLCLLVATAVVGSSSVWFPWIALSGLVLLGLVPPMTSNHTAPHAVATVASRLMGWLSIGGGIVVILGQLVPANSPELAWTMVVLWTSAWVVLWRLCSPDRETDTTEKRRRSVVALADMEFSSILLVGVIIETIALTVTGDHRMGESAWYDPLMWTRVLAYVSVAISGLARGGRTAAWTIALGTTTASVSFIAGHIAVSTSLAGSQRWACVLLPAGFLVALAAHWLAPLSALLARFAGGNTQQQRQAIGRSTWQVAVLVASFACAAVIGLMTNAAPSADIRLTALTVVLAAWAIAVTAEVCDLSAIRHLAVATGLMSIGLLASISGMETAHPFLAACMRWLVVTVITAPTLIFLAPRLLGESMAQKWQSTLAVGAKATGIVAIGSLTWMLVLEVALRENGRVTGVQTALILMVAATLVALSVLAASLAILTGPRSTLRDRLSVTDTQRRGLIVAAQAFGVVTWLHLFLCDREWAFAGLRAYWPFVVMGLAFASVAIVEWSRRRQDLVLSDTLSYTALYLPMIPVIGFWLSGSLTNWRFVGEMVRYDMLLALGAAYYLFLSGIWNKMMPRVTGIVLANAAWWVVLVQQPGWGFLAHPQLWLIPPAACVLVVVHLYRDRLDPKVTASVRYASTLVIYISSTADMLIQQVGTHWSGPIILIVLALFGMLMGVVLRVRPFLYLGATFVFLGVTSMVWHAHQAFDAVWLWWVFGITTGICLLAGLMAIEKNKPKLRRYAEHLAGWNG